jgi:16S rRNA G1207 methylase RsmC
MGGGNRVKRRVVKQLIAIDTALLLSYIRPQKKQSETADVGCGYIKGGVV